MKLNNQIYAFLLITLSTALTSVLAQQPVRIQTTVDSELASICGEGYRAWDFTDWEHLPPGHMWYGTAPDEDKGAWDSAENLTQRKLQKWNEDCCLKCPKKKCIWVPKSSGECAK